MRFLQLVTLLGVVASPFPAYAEETSGTYVGKDAKTAVLLQVVRTPDSQLRGRYEQIVLQPDGKLARLSAAVTGASDGRTVVVTIKATESSPEITASGTVDGSVLHLNGSGPGANLELTFIKSEEADFRSHVAA